MKNFEVTWFSSEKKSTPIISESSESIKLNQVTVIELLRPKSKFLPMFKEQNKR